MIDVQIEALVRFKNRVALNDADYERLYEIFQLGSNQTLYHVKKHTKEKNKHAHSTKVNNNKKKETLLIDTYKLILL
jgi:hypothetical protein